MPLIVPVRVRPETDVLAVLHAVRASNNRAGPGLSDDATRG